MADKYQLYKVQNGVIKHLVRGKNGYHLSSKYASVFDYETALLMMTENGRKYTLTLCDEKSEFFKHQGRYVENRLKFDESDILFEIKVETLHAACDLQYPDETLDAIVNATKESQIVNAMTNARKRTA